VDAGSANAGRAADTAEPRWVIAIGVLTAAVGLVRLGVLDVSDTPVVCCRGSPCSALAWRSWLCR
jgi:hypothetical protein